MKKYTLIMLLGLLFNLTSYAGSLHADVDIVQAKNVLIRTNRVIGHAHMSVKRGGNHSGDLSKAVKYERTAKKLFQEGDYLRAVQHSRLARIYAVQAIKINKVKPPLEASFTPAENQLFGEIPSEQELQKQMELKEPYQIKDEDLMNGKLDLELNNG